MGTLQPAYARTFSVSEHHGVSCRTCIDQDVCQYADMIPHQDVDGQLAAIQFDGTGIGE